LTWPRLVTASASVVLLAVLGLGAWWVASSERRVTSYSVRGTLSAIALDLGNADAEIVGGREAPVVDVRRTDSFAFDQPPRPSAASRAGTLSLRSRCPVTVLGSCSASYRLTVPNNVPVTIRTASGNVRLNGFRGSARIDTLTGDVSASAYCGFVLRARAEEGDVSAVRRRARRTGWSCAAAAATSGPSCRRAATGSTPTATRAASASTA
jgi:hypothetical protein